MALVSALALAVFPAGAVVARSTSAPVMIPSLVPWAGSNGRPNAEAWRHAARFSLANQFKPGHNLPARIRTDAYVGYTPTALWVHFVAYDPQPADIHLKYRQRDDLPVAADYVGVILNPFNDTQWGYEFVCSAAGTEFDEIRQQGNEYSSFNAIWYCDAQRTKTGYTVTLHIPLRSLKFPHADQPQNWRLMLERNRARGVRYETSQVRINFNSKCLKLCAMQPVRTQTPIQADGGGWLLIPTATVSQTDARSAAPGSALEPGSPDFSGGIDARWALRPDLMWSATLNPDFSQVAPDVLQSTVNQRFALFHEENRPFFEQGTWVFNTPGFDFGHLGLGSQSRFVDTRQIADPRWATKLVGRPDNQGLGVLVAQDQTTNILLPGAQTSRLASFDFPTRDMLVRYRYNFPDHSTLGVLATSRHGNGYGNDVVVAGGRWQIDPSDLVTVQATHSTTSYPESVAAVFGVAAGRRAGDGWMVSLARTRDHYHASISAGQVDPGFRADLGYVPQVGYRHLRTHYEYDWYAHDSWWNNIGVGGGYDWVGGAGGGLVLGRQLQAYAFVNAVGQSHIALYARRQQQRFGGKAFAFNQVELDASAQPWHWFKFELDTIGGEAVDHVGVRKGRLTSLAPSFTLSPGSHLKLAFVGSFERLQLPRGWLYRARLYDLRIAWYFDSRMFVRAIGQAQDIRRNPALYPSGEPSRTRQLAAQLLFGYVINPWTSFYAGMTDGYAGTGTADLAQQLHSLFVKVSYAF